MRTQKPKVNKKLQAELSLAYSLQEENRDWYQVNEMFDSIQGEGVLVGKPSTFIRLQGCSVGCPWCDTKYTWATRKGKGDMLGTSMHPKEIAKAVKHNHVVITGGEPTIWNLDMLIRELRLANPKCFIQIETSGQFWFKGRERPDWITWSPKESLGFGKQVHEKWYYHADEIKFVIDEHFTWDTAIEMDMQAHEVGNDPYIVLMPEGSPPTKENVDRTLAFFDRIRDRLYTDKWRLGHRLQYVIGVE